MTGAMYAAIAGLRTHMQNLNVIGNNVANVNTSGYKSSRAVFKTSLYTSLSGGSNGTAVMGGTNPSQIGYGSSVANVDIDMSTGNYAVTGNPTDLMLDGDGFFLVGDKEIANNFDGTENDVGRLTSLTLTRVGDFGFKADGYFAKNDGNVVYGFLCIGKYSEEDIYEIDNTANPPTKTRKPDVPQTAKVGDPKFSDQLVPIRYPRVREVTKYYYADPQDPDAVVTEVTDATAIEALEQQIAANNGQLPAGYTSEKAMEIAYPTAGVDGVKDAQTAITDADGNITYEDLPQGIFTGISIDKVTGLITGTSNDTKEIVTIGCVAVGLVTNPNGVTNMGDNYYKAGNGSGQLTIGVLGGNAANMGISHVNGSKYSAPTNGNAPGGNDDTTYEPPDGLRIRTSETKMLSSGLEMSKTDLAQEIANMILTQRGYQANTRIITVTDSMLEELVNMKR